MAMGSRICLNLASATFLSSTSLKPFFLRTTSSLGRLKARVCTPALVSPAVKSSSTTSRAESSSLKSATQPDTAEEQPAPTPDKK